MSHTIEEIREAMHRMHWLAIGDPRGRAYMSIPADPRRDADLILSAAIDELQTRRSQVERLTAAVLEARTVYTSATLDASLKDTKP